MRLMQRTTVDFPEPDGPIIAVTLLASYSRLKPFTACVVAVPGVEVLHEHPAAAAAFHLGAGDPVFVLREL